MLFVLHRRDQAAAVGMPGVAEQLRGRGSLDHVAGVHDPHAVGDLREHASVFG